MEFLRVSDDKYIMNISRIICPKDLAQNPGVGGNKGTPSKCEILRKGGVGAYKGLGVNPGTYGIMFNVWLCLLTWPLF